QADRAVRVEGRADRVLHRQDLGQEPRLRIQEHYSPDRAHHTAGTRRRAAEQGEQGHDEDSSARTPAPGERDRTRHPIATLASGGLRANATKVQYPGAAP